MARLDAQLIDWLSTVGSLVPNGQQMHEDHRRLESLFEDLIERMRGGDWTACDASWAELERHYVAHLDKEEQHLIPWFERDDAFEAAAILDDHRHLREQLAELGLRLELHSIRDDHIQRLLDLHRHHAAREERMAHQWPERSFPREIVRAVLARISHQISSAFFL